MRSWIRWSAFAAGVSCVIFSMMESTRASVAGCTGSGYYFDGDPAFGCPLITSCYPVLCTARQGGSGQNAHYYCTCDQQGAESECCHLIQWVEDQPPGSGQFGTIGTCDDESCPEPTAQACGWFVPDPDPEDPGTIGPIEAICSE